MIDGFSHSIKEQPDSNAAGKEHDEPRDVIVFWLAQLQFGILAAVENHGKNGPQVLTSDVKPGKVVHNPTFPGLEGNLLFLHGTPNDKTPNCSYRKERHYGVEPDLAQQR